MNKIWNMLWYGGLDQKTYYEVLPDVRQENRKNLVVFSGLAFGAFFVSFLMRLANSFGMQISSILIIAAGFLVMLTLSKTLAVKKGWICDAMVYAYTIGLLWIGIYSSITQPVERTTLLLPFFVFSAVLFCEKILIYLIILMGSELAFLYMIYHTQEGLVLVANRTNTIIFCGVGAFTAFYIMNMKYRKHEANYLNKFLLERDALTGVYNRHFFEKELERIKKEKLPVAICAFDVNELKRINDSLGHGAGDELIIGAAQCISESFEDYGKVFRTGGDEFIAILVEEIDKPEELLARFKAKQEAWRGQYVDTLNVSCGIAVLDHDYDTMLSDTLKKADQLMYEEKRKYYLNKGIERRKV